MSEDANQTFVNVYMQVLKNKYDQLLIENLNLETQVHIMKKMLEEKDELQSTKKTPTKSVENK